MVALRKFFEELDAYDKCVVSIEYLIDLEGKNKTNSIQLSSNKIRGFGITNDILTYRGAKEHTEEELDKVSGNCGIKRNSIFWSKTMDNIYEIPFFYNKAGLFHSLQSFLNLKNDSKILKMKRNLKNLPNCIQ